VIKKIIFNKEITNLLLSNLKHMPYGENYMLAKHSFNRRKTTPGTVKKSPKHTGRIVKLERKKGKKVKGKKVI